MNELDVSNAEPLVRDLKTLRRKAQLTTQELGKAVGLAAATLALYESGHMDIGAQSAVKLHKFFNLDDDEIIVGKELIERAQFEYERKGQFLPIKELRIIFYLGKRKELTNASLSVLVGKRQDYLSRLNNNAKTIKDEDIKNLESIIEYLKNYKKGNNNDE